jgi:hypothetical protein
MSSGFDVTPLPEGLPKTPNDLISGNLRASQISMESRILSVKFWGQKLMVTQLGGGFFFDARLQVGS